MVSRLVRRYDIHSSNPSFPRDEEEEGARMGWDHGWARGDSWWASNHLEWNVLTTAARNPDSARSMVEGESTFLLLCTSGC